MNNIVTLESHIKGVITNQARQHNSSILHITVVCTSFIDRERLYRTPQGVIALSMCQTLSYVSVIVNPVCKVEQNVLVKLNFIYIQCDSNSQLCIQS